MSDPTKLINYNVHASTGETLKWFDTEREARQWIFDHGLPGDFVLAFEPDEEIDS